MKNQEEERPAPFGFPRESGGCRCGRRSCSGFTLVEFLVGVAVLGILASLAAPSLGDMLRSNRAAILANEIVASLSLARAEAVKRAANVSVCKTADPTAATPACSANAGWADGWLVFVDDGTPGVVDGADTRLQVVKPGAGGASILGDANFAAYAGYDARGAAANGTGGTLVLCVGGVQRSIAVSATGRTKVTPGAC